MALFSYGAREWHWKGMKMAFRSYSVLYPLPSPPLSVSLFLCVSVSVSLSGSVALSLFALPFVG